MPHTVRITDLKTSILEQQKRQTPIYTLGWAISEEIKYVWVGRVNHHTPEEIAEGYRQNPNLATMPLEDFCKLVGTEIKPEGRGATVVCWPQKNGLSLFTTLCFPAYTEGVEGNYVEVTFTEDNPA